MNYELARELRDAGFPIIEHSNRAPEPRTFSISYPSHEVLYIPTLEELIEACGDFFYQLEQYQASGEWVARAYVDGKIISTKFDVHSINDPDTVVAVLWLMLQKKNPA